MPPRASPETTVPSTSTGRPSSGAAPRTSPAATSCRIRVDETPSTCGATRVAIPSRSSSARSPLRPRPKRKSSPATTSSAPIAARYDCDELLRRERGDLGRELDDERLLDAELGQQLEPALERREQRDLVPEHLARMRMERDHGRQRPGLDRRADDRAVAEVDAVERADRDRARPPLELAGRAGDLHRATGLELEHARPDRLGHARDGLGGRRASASDAGISRSGSASSTPNGPTAVRRSVRQWPPSACAIERTYVPELTCSVERDALVVAREHVERVDLRAPHRHLDHDALPRELVGALAADLHRRVRRDRQLDLAAQALEPRVELLGRGGSCRSTTSPSGSPVVVVAVRSISVT